MISEKIIQTIKIESVDYVTLYDIGLHRET